MRSVLLLIALTCILGLNDSCSFSNRNESNDNLFLVNANNEGSKPETRMSLCALLINATRFDNKDVEINAVLITGREYTYLYDPSCRGKKEKEIWYEIKSEGVNKKLDSIINPENPEYKTVGLIRVKADFLGTLIVKKDTGFGPEGYYLYKFLIRDINNISPVAEDVPYPWQ